MAENIPNIPTGAMPPKKETGKVQPKKETVRINLPPKPSAAPTIKLPTLPPGGPTGATSVPAAASCFRRSCARTGRRAPCFVRAARPASGYRIRAGATRCTRRARRPQPRP